MRVSHLERQAVAHHSQGWRRIAFRVRDQGTEIAGRALAALIVFGRVADPGDARLWLLVAVTAVGPLLLVASVRRMFRPLRRWWRRRGRPRNAEPDGDPLPDQAGEAPAGPAAQHGE
ncbi:hypothetical protein Adi01nite_41330 [Amorphoplanes digitatis]|nr:hypothetical protein Adi01nite_41330 [Actinoplanes digitatis]